MQRQKKKKILVQVHKFQQKDIQKDLQQYKEHQTGKGQNLYLIVGGNSGYAKGTAWFSDFTLEEGTADNSNEWKFAYFILENTDVNVDGKQVNIKVTENDIKDIKQTINRFTTSCEELSQRKMKCLSDMYEITAPLTELSYDEQFGYYVSPENVEELIKKYIEGTDYDHIFVIMRLR